MSYTTPDFADDVIARVRECGLDVRELADDDTRSNGGRAGFLVFNEDGIALSPEPHETELEAWKEALHRATGLVELLDELEHDERLTTYLNDYDPMLTGYQVGILQAGLLCLAQVNDQCAGDLPEDIRAELPEGIESVGDAASELAAKLSALTAQPNRHVTLRYELTDQAMSDLLTTAVESGTAAVRYWADITRILRDNPTDLNVVEFEADVQDGPVTVDNPDIPAAEVSRFVCDRQTMRDGIRRLLAPGANVNASIRNDVMLLCADPEHAADADTADAVVQFAVFGELVFG